MSPCFQLDLIMIIIVENLNDNPPVFDQNTYRVNVNEMSPVDTSVGRFPATDLDGNQIYYKLTPESTGFKLSLPTNPELLVETPLDYDKVKNVQLILSAQDTPLAPASSRVSFTASTTIMVTILDVDNRPPWFQPCSKHEVGGAVICQSAGYTTKVVLNEQETGVLPLEPGPLYAIDGDSGINEAMTYSFLNGDADGLFAINPNTGNITMLKPTDVLETISLTVLAAQRTNSYQFATTSVTVSVQVKSLHPPKFQSPQYEGIITAVGVMAMDPKNKDQPLRILATDDDYNATGGLNPHITYYVDGNSDFSIIGGYLFMTKDLPEATLSLQVVAMDTSNEESATARLSVEVTSGGYGLVDMAALGATLGVLLFICLVVIVVLAVRIRKGKANWKKIYEASMFQSSLGQGSGGQKEGIQYTNEAFQNDEDGGSTGSGSPAGESVMAGDLALDEAIVKSSVPLHALLHDDTSHDGSDNADSEKEVKPILTKERRMDDGYKSVWFKEDIEPDAKEEVVIIPDSREDDSEDDDDEQSSSENGDDTRQIKTPRVVFNEADLDSGLGVKMDDPAEDSEDDDALTADL
ncbi:cadherin-related family member 5 isoform X2 [Sander lucioperca]|uniref:cadherin-related family member 5 isoform X2 n=1 Tax=Sander lucioperca TaxID=283035 RepID=UPI00125D2E74|nr:cadherin-related family member 5 isoform X2 [Sander lucioperca]